MALHTHPLVCIRKRDGKVEEVTVGPSAGRAVVIVVVVIVVAVLVGTGRVTWSDAVAAARFVPRF